MYKYIRGDYFEITLGIEEEKSLLFERVTGEFYGNTLLKEWNFTLSRKE